MKGTPADRADGGVMLAVQEAGIRSNICVAMAPQRDHAKLKHIEHETAVPRCRLEAMSGPTKLRRFQAEFRSSDQITCLLMRASAHRA